MCESIFWLDVNGIKWLDVTVHCEIGWVFELTECSSLVNFIQQFLHLSSCRVVLVAVCRIVISCNGKYTILHQRIMMATIGCVYANSMSLDPEVNRRSINIQIFKGGVTGHSNEHS